MDRIVKLLDLALTTDRSNLAAAIAAAEDASAALDRHIDQVEAEVFLSTHLPLETRRQFPEWAAARRREEHQLAAARDAAIARIDELRQVVAEANARKRAAEKLSERKAAERRRAQDKSLRAGAA